jgi:hypothetical protein
MLFVAIQGFAINTLGDAARYLSPHPANIGVRHRIRAQGIDLLKRLHDSGDYDRIVVVGHSLGSVIGYDVITNLWDQLNSAPAPRYRKPQPGLGHVEKLGKDLPDAPSADELAQFQAAQLKLWAEQRALGYPWIISDFITLGSPLAHAAFLLADDARDLTTRQQLRELPSCPPIAEKSHYSYVVRYEIDGTPAATRRLHHAAPFAVTRWTNIYSPNFLGLFGDWVGGPLRKVFGRGIRDVAITAGLLRFIPLVPHILYWRGQPPRQPGSRTHAISALRSALDLGSAGWLPRSDRSNSDGATAPDDDPGSAPAREVPEQNG